MILKSSCNGTSFQFDGISYSHSNWGSMFNTWSNVFVGDKRWSDRGSVVSEKSSHFNTNQWESLNWEKDI
jgi:hypothetical protein